MVRSSPLLVVGDQQLLTLHLASPVSDGLSDFPTVGLLDDAKVLIECVFGPTHLHQLATCPTATACCEASACLGAMLPWVVHRHETHEPSNGQLRSAMHHSLASLGVFCSALAASLSARAQAAALTPAPAAVAIVSGGAILQGNAQWWSWASLPRTRSSIAPLLVQQACAARLNSSLPAAGGGAAGTQELTFASQRLWLPHRTHGDDVLCEITVAPLSVAVRPRADAAAAAAAGPCRSVARRSAQSAPGSNTSLRPVLSTAGSETSVRVVVIEVLSPPPTTPPTSAHNPPPR